MVDITVSPQVTKLVVVSAETASPVVIAATSEVQVPAPVHPQVDVQPDEFEIVLTTGGIQGPPGQDGADGTTGGAIILEKTAGAALGGHRMVRSVAGVVTHADTTIEAHGDDVLGLTTQSALLGALVQVVAYGEITEPSWSWTPGEPLFLGQNGALSHTPDPAAAFDLVVGFAQTPTTVLIDLGTPIYMET